MSVNKGKNRHRSVNMFHLTAIFYLSLFLVPLLQPADIIVDVRPPTQQATKIDTLPEPTIKPAELLSEVAVAEKSPTPPPAAPSGSCRDWIIQAGIADVESAYTLIMRESSCNPASRNSIGCIGLGQNCPQKGHYWLIDACPNWQNDPVCQLKRFTIYVEGRYGSWAGALSFSNRNGWY